MPSIYLQSTYKVYKSVRMVLWRSFHNPRDHISLLRKDAFPIRYVHFWVLHYFRRNFITLLRNVFAKRSESICHLVHFYDGSSLWFSNGVSLCKIRKARSCSNHWMGWLHLQLIPQRCNSQSRQCYT